MSQSSQKTIKINNKMAMTSTERNRRAREQKKIIKLESDFENMQTVVYGKIMPHSLDLEEIILGSIMLEIGAIEKVLKIFQNKNPFYTELHAILYDCMLEIYKKKFTHPDRIMV